MRRITLSLLGAAIAAGVAVLPAAAKEGVEATLATSLPLEAEPGTQLRVAWTLTYVNEDGQQQPFGASGVFVRVLSATGAGAEEAFDSMGAHPTGEYAATVVVPEGGIGDIEIGLRGWASGPSGTRRSDLLFPIENDPLPGPPRSASPPSEQAVSERGETGSLAWAVVVGLASLLVMCALAAAFARRKRASHAYPGPPANEL